jgi:hypothetical protein
MLKSLQLKAVGITVMYVYKTKDVDNNMERGVFGQKISSVLYGYLWG